MFTTDCHSQQQSNQPKPIFRQAHHHPYINTQSIPCYPLLLRSQPFIVGSKLAIGLRRSCYKTESQKNQKGHCQNGDDHGYEFSDQKFHGNLLSDIRPALKQPGGLPGCRSRPTLPQCTAWKYPEHTAGRIRIPHISYSAPPGTEDPECIHLRHAPPEGVHTL